MGQPRVGSIAIGVARPAQSSARAAVRTFLSFLKASESALSSDLSIDSARFGRMNRELSRPVASGRQATLGV